ncbi:MAG TPA: winged helix-turn-helix domain-containing protein [Pyrinomonadaceae bacterium]
MPAINENTSVYRFDDFVVDARTRVLLRDGQPVPLTPRVFDTLLALVVRPGETITKDELMNSIWADSFVEEANLTQNVAVLRKALGEDSRRPRYIVTIPGKGYRFTPEVVEDSLETENVAAEGNGSGTTDAIVPEHSAGAPRTKVRRKVWMVLATAVLLIALSAAAIFSGVLFLGGASAPSVARARQITSFAGLDLYPAFSPAGHAVAFTSNKSGSFEIYTKQLVQGAQEIQLTSGGMNNFQPAYSPDSSRLAFYSASRGGIWVIPASGGVPKRLTDFGSNPTWSPDGSAIAFQSDPLNDFSASVRNAMPPSTLWVVAADGTSTPQQITQVGNPPGGHGAPDWSPDGKRIVFDSNDWSASGLWSVAADGSDLRMVFDKEAYEGGRQSVTASDAIFAPDGKAIFFVGDVGQSIQFVPIDSDGRAVGSPSKVFDASATRARHISLSPDGKQLIYSAINTTSNLFLSDVGDARQMSEPKQVTMNADSRVVSPSFSPDGGTIVYQEYNAGSAPNIRLMDADGRNQRQIGTVLGFNPWWFPSGDRIGFSTGGIWGSEYWFVAADGSVERKLFSFDETDVYNGRLSADGKSVLFNSKRSGTINIWQVSIEGGEPKQLTFDPEMAGFPAMSRDGKWIAVQLKRGGDTHVAVMPAEGGEVVQLTNEPGQSWVYDWAPDNDRILFAGRRGSNWNIYSVSRTTREVRQLTNFSKLTAYVRYPAWSPLGDKIAYEYAESTGNIWMVELK